MILNRRTANIIIRKKLRWTKKRYHSFLRKFKRVYKKFINNKNFIPKSIYSNIKLHENVVGDYKSLTLSQKVLLSGLNVDKSQPLKHFITFVKSYDERRLLGSQFSILFWFYGLILANEECFNAYLCASEGLIDWSVAYDYICETGKQIREEYVRGDTPGTMDLDELLRNDELDFEEEEEEEDSITTNQHKNHFISLKDVYPFKKVTSINTLMYRHAFIIARAEQLHYKAHTVKEIF